jgi:hypothetical protein
VIGCIREIRPTAFQAKAILPVRCLVGIKKR